MSDAQLQADWRIKLGFVLFVLSIAWPLLLPVMPLVGFSGSAIAAFSGGMLVAAEIMILAGAAIAGKDGFKYIKERVFGFLKSHGPPKAVTRTRYIFGLILFVAPLFFGWVSPYVAEYLPGFPEHARYYEIAGDVLLLGSLFVLGGEFWDKLRSLFLHRAHAVIPEKQPKHAQNH
jgi:hypothetical protein